jgi:hypothetical protein
MFAKVHKVSFPQKDAIMPSAEELKLMCKLLSKPKHGDLVCNTALTRYRNTGLYIYDGKQKKVIELNVTLDEYGHLPKQFKIWEKHEDGFIIPANYWHEAPKNADGTYSKRVIEHNSLVCFDHAKYRKELLENISYNYLKEFDKYAIYTWFTLNGEKYRIIYDFTSNEEHEFKFVDEDKLSITFKERTFLIGKFKDYLKKDKIASFNCFSWESEYPESKNQIQTIHLWGGLEEEVLDEDIKYKEV